MFWVTHWERNMVTDFNGLEIDYMVLDLDRVLRKPWSCLTTFGTSTSWSKMECPGEAEIVGSHSFCGLVDPAKGLLGFM
jgi:hypothetical protein